MTIWHKVTSDVDSLPSNYTNHERFYQATSFKQEVVVKLADSDVPRIALFEIMKYDNTNHPRHNSYWFTGNIYHVDGVEYQCDIFDNVTHWTEIPNFE